MLAIYKREVKAYFQSVIGWLFLAATIFLAGLYFFATNLVYGYADLTNTIGSILFLLIITIPILSMRILSEDKKQKTDQLTLTSPVSIGSIVMGKYLAMATIFTISTLVICTFPLILSAFGEVPYGESYKAILAYYLFGLTGLAIGLFVSSITESQVIAAVLSFGIFFLGYMMSSITQLISSTGNLLTDILNCFDFYGRMMDMMQGTLELKSVVYFLTIIFVCIFLTIQSIQKRRYQISVKSLKMGAYSTSMIAIVLVAAVFLNLAVNQLPGSMTGIDVTSQKLYSLTDTTEEVLANLEEDVTIYVLDSEDGEDVTLGQTLQRYAGASDHIKIEYKDPVVYPNFYQEYTDDTTLRMNSLIVESSKRSTVINYSDIYEYDYSSSYYGQVSGYDAEGLLTSAISYVTGDDMPVVYTLEGQDEETIPASFQDGIKKLNIETQSLNLLTEESVPEDAAGVIIFAPQSDISENVADQLIAYLDKGGKIFVTTTYIDNFSETMPNLSKVLDYFGLSVADGLVMEGDRNYYTQLPFYLLPNVEYDTITDGLTGSDDVIFMPYAQAINKTETEGVTVTDLLTTSSSAYIKTGVNSLQDIRQTDHDPAGTFTLAVNAEKSLGEDTENTAQLTLYTSSTLFSEEANSQVADRKLKLFTNTVGTMAGEETNVSIPVKSYSIATVTVDFGNAIMIAAVIMVIIPLTLIIVGIVNWMRRRKR